MTTRQPLTDTQRRALDIMAVLVDRTAAIVKSVYPDVIPSKWVFETELNRMGVRSDTMRALARKGYIERSESGGFGWQYRTIS